MPFKATKKRPASAEKSAAKKRVAAKKPSRKSSKSYVTVANRSYGKALRGMRIWWEGRRPSSLKDDGRINLGKNILEILAARFPRFRWIITKDVDSITVERGVVKVRTSQKLLSRMGGEHIDRNRDIKNDIIRKFFSITFTDFFKEEATEVYVPGTLAKTLHPDIIPRLSGQDKKAVNRFLPDYISSESLGMVNKLKATAQIETLKELAANLEKEIPRERPESWWQAYVKSNILLRVFEHDGAEGVEELGAVPER